jgi:hypothetical protein
MGVIGRATNDKENAMNQNLPYPDASGYDSEGYGLQTGMHKRTGVRRDFRVEIDKPLTKTEHSITATYRRQLSARNLRIANCTHDMVAINHEESRCRKCGGVFLMPDR